MSECYDSDDSAPSLSSYPPAFVSLISTFIKRAEEAETRAHKSLVILQAKDDQLTQLQQRMEVLEKIACRLEEVMVPPLDLPKSPQSCEDLRCDHPRDVNIKQSNITPLETLYKRFNPAQQESSRVIDFNSDKSQCLIDSLERSNCQLREALAAESQKRVKDHEQYVATLDKVTQAFKELQKNKDWPSSHNQHTIEVVHCENDNVNLPRGTQQSISAEDKEKLTVNGNSLNKNDRLIKSDHVAIFKEDFKGKMDLAEQIISVLQRRLEKRQKRKCLSNRKIRPTTGAIKSGTFLGKALSMASLRSNNTPKSCRNLKLKRVHTSQCFLSVLKKQNKNLKKKYRHVCEKFTESLTLCERLRKELVFLSVKNKKNIDLNVEKSTQSTQTEEILDVSLFNYFQEKPAYSSRSTNLLQGRLEAAAKVMAKQCKQIQDLQKKLGENVSQIDNLRKRLAKAESTAAAKEVLVESTKKQCQDLESINVTLSQELQQFKDSGFRLRKELVLKTEECCRIKREKEICEAEFNEMKISLESKLLALSSALQHKEQANDQMTTDLENKLSSLKGQFIAQVSEASDRLVAADFKIQELYLGIETFLKLLFTVNSPELSPSSQAQAVQVASDILQLPAAEVQTILHSSRCDLRVGRWIRECNRMVHEKVFAKNLGNLLLDAVLEAKIA